MNIFVPIGGLIIAGTFLLGFAIGREYSDPRCFEDEVVISWHTGYTCEPLDNLPLELQRRIDE